jgi:hypothetical protein
MFFPLIREIFRRLSTSASERSSCEYGLRNRVIMLTQQTNPPPHEPSDCVKKKPSVYCDGDGGLREVRRVNHDGDTRSACSTNVKRGFRFPRLGRPILNLARASNREIEVESAAVAPLVQHFSEQSW